MKKTKGKRKEKQLMAQILCSTGALIGRPNNRDYHLLQQLAGKLDCDGYEFMMYDTWYDQVEDILTFLKALNLNIPVMHCEKQIGEDISRGITEDVENAFRRFAINCDMAKTLGAKKLVMHLWGGQASDQNFANNLAAYPKARSIADTYGIDLLVENIVCNKDNPMQHWEELAAQYPDIHLIYDTKMAAFHAQENLLYDKAHEWLWRDGHIRHFHVNDYDGGYMDWSRLKTLPIGQGHVDFARFFDFIRRTGYDDTFTVEATAFDRTGAVDTAMLNQCFERIRKEMR